MLQRVELKISNKNKMLTALSMHSETRANVRFDGRVGMTGGIRRVDNSPSVLNRKSRIHRN